MARPKMFYKYELPQGVIKLVRAQCADYERRELALRSDDLTAAVRATYIATNEAIRKALEDCEECLRLGILIDIAECRGYDWSRAAQYLNRKAYYNRKRKAIYDIATLLNLV